MKGDRLGELEELTLLAIKILGDNAYGVAVQEVIEREAARTVALGAVYAALDRLELKGLVRSMLSVAVAERGGRRRRVFQVTGLGVRAVRESETGARSAVERRSARVARTILMPPSLARLQRPPRGRRVGLEDTSVNHGPGGASRTTRTRRHSSRVVKGFCR